MLWCIVTIFNVLDSEHLIELEKGFKEADRILEEIGNIKQKVRLTKFYLDEIYII